MFCWSDSAAVKRRGCLLIGCDPAMISTSPPTGRNARIRYANHGKQSDDLEAVRKLVDTLGRGARDLAKALEMP